MAGRHEIYLKEAEDKNGNIYYAGWSKQTGAVTIFIWPKGEAGYSGKVFMSSRVRKRLTAGRRSRKGYFGGGRTFRSYGRYQKKSR